MIHDKLISSIQNPLIKKIKLLQEKSRERKKTGLFVIEGKREIQLAKKGGYTIDQLLYSKEIIDFSIEDFIADFPETSCVEVSYAVYQKLAYRQSTEGILAVAQGKSHTLENIHFSSKNPLVLVAEAPEKPGNIGALLRTADAARLDAVLIANPKSDVYNPNIIRSSVGCVFTSQIGLGSTEEIISLLKNNRISIRCAALSASKTYTESNLTGPLALVVGTESSGLTDEWLKNSDENLIIPMKGEIDSMNVSVSAAILIFEAARQRGF
ncbi:TrmH family RNA methyltransferase [Flagellimonas meridianipacifica]|uniref:TrmH family RNA methyltransferase n=1 Tax=Flagellimonas meridianipacifica TaxID=1080225 RepID=A0A2T0M9K9_9FLAO|nr:RNA methyltransferase [Allomuricauda pacifica]PRX54194.1 TrmH family RNA methyltransferase [Allomuricauda pacifica]